MNRHKDYEASRRLIVLAENHPIPDENAKGAAFAQARKDMEAAGKRGLSSLDQALVALPAYREQVEAELRALVLPPPDPGEWVFEWRPVSVLAGKRFKTEGDVDQVLDKVSRDLKAQIRGGFTVVVK